MVLTGLGVERHGMELTPMTTGVEAARLEDVTVS